MIAKEYTKILDKNYQFDSSIKFVFAEYGFFIQQAFMDIAMGYSEIFKSKIKPIFEMLAINNYLNNQMRDKEKYVLLYDLSGYSVCKIYLFLK